MSGGGEEYGWFWWFFVDDGDGDVNWVFEICFGDVVLDVLCFVWFDFFVVVGEGFVVGYVM